MSRRVALCFPRQPLLKERHHCRFLGAELRKVVRELVLGPFQGRPACIRIPFGEGVCGAAAASREVQRVEDVNAFPGHIACDSASNSEIVVPLVRDGEVLGVLDIDSPRLGRFDAEDEAGIVRLAEIILGAI